MSDGMVREGSSLADVGGVGHHGSFSAASGSSCSTGGPISHCWYGPSIKGQPPDARAAHSADVIGGNKIYVFGGWNGKKAMNDLYVLETEKMVWRQIQLKNVPPERNNVSSSILLEEIARGGYVRKVEWRLSPRHLWQSVRTLKESRIEINHDGIILSNAF